MTGSVVVGALKGGFRDTAAYYAVFQQARQESPVVRDDFLQAHVVLGYVECEQVLRDTEGFGRAPLDYPATYFEDVDARVLAGYETMRAMSIFQPPGAAYAARRQQLLAAVSAARRASAAGLVDELAQELVAPLDAGRELDLYAGSLRPFAARCAGIALTGSADVPPEITAAALAAAFFFDGKRPARPHVLDAFAGVATLAEWIEDRLFDGVREQREAVADLVLLFVAAHESMAYLLHVVLARMACSGADLARFDDGDRIAAALGESLRFDAPVQMTARVARRDVHIGAHAIAAGERVLLHLGAANRDPAVFARPDAYIEGRGAAPLSFGWGATRCVGADFAQRCAGSYLRHLGARFRSVSHREEGSVFDHGISARGMKSAFYTLG